MTYVTRVINTRGFSQGRTHGGSGFSRGHTHGQYRKMTPIQLYGDINTESDKMNFPYMEADRGSDG